MASLKAIEDKIWSLEHLTPREKTALLHRVRKNREADNKAEASFDAFDRMMKSNGGTESSGRRDPSPRGRPYVNLGNGGRKISDNVTPEMTMA